MSLNVGAPAPDFALMNQDKTVVKLSELRGKKVVLLFYPMDFSPVCTQEHCGFGPDIGKIRTDDKTVVFGVSTDSPFAHAAFKRQYGLPYDLLADVTRQTSKAYDMFAGEQPYNCSKRGTVVIGPDGKIAHWEEVPMKDPRSAGQIAAAVA